jgi:prepilin-type processing-associated H-X9-DG protein
LTSDPAGADNHRIPEGGETMSGLEGFLLERMTVRRWLIALLASIVICCVLGVGAGYLIGRSSAFSSLASSHEDAMKIDTPYGPISLTRPMLEASLARAQTTANRIKSASNLRQIGQALEIFANEHHGASPKTLEELAKAESLDADVLRCPRSPNIHYVYVGHWRTDEDPRGVVAYEDGSESNSDIGDGGSILFADGSVEFEGVLDRGRILAVDFAMTDGGAKQNATSPSQQQAKTIDTLPPLPPIVLH